MTPEETKEAISVMEAHLHGAAVQWTPIRCNGWQDVADPMWDWNHCEYRVKPEPPKPREWWEVKGTAALDFIMASTLFADALNYVQNRPEKRLSIFHVREVLEDSK